MMKIKDDFLLKVVAGNYIILPVGDNLVNFNAMITTNETGAFLWNALKEGTTEEKLVSALMNEYEVEPDVAKADVLRFIKTLQDRNIIE